MYVWIVYGNLFIALAALGLVWLSALSLAITGLGWELPALVFGATLFVYNLDRLVSSTEDRHAMSERHRWIVEHSKSLRALAALGLLMILVCAPLLNLATLSALAALGLLSLAYALPLLPSRAGMRRAKSVPGLKIFLIGICWATVTVSLPLLEQSPAPSLLRWLSEGASLTTLADWPDWIARALTPPAWKAWAQRLLYIIAITLPFDLRDLAKDARAEILTLPHLLGPDRSRWLAAGLCGLGAMLALARLGMDRPAMLAAELVAMLSALVLVLAWRDDRPESYYGLLLDGHMLAYLGLCALAS